MITKKEIQYKNYGKCLEISNDLVRLVVTTELGPRIINFSFIDGENIMFEDIEREMTMSDSEHTAAFGGGTWYIYGGHRLWTSPEAAPRSYYPDNDPVEVTLTENGAVFTPPVQVWNQYGYTLEVSLAENSTDVTILHRVTNHAGWEVTLAPWAITVLSTGGTEIIPQNTRDTGLLGNRLLALWPYAKMTDPRVTWGDKYIILRQDSEAEGNFKLGLDSEHAFAMYFNHGDLFIKKYATVDGAPYPDGGMNFETYTNRLFLEMESLGPQQTIAPGASAEHVEYWSLHKEALPALDEENLDQVVKRYV
ncbi:MAG: hypothetical protein E7414_01740 [Ruminococcaceae bacterium]|nr:hypothetical protein [Oscillospiraceae bacterium]